MEPNMCLRAHVERAQAAKFLLEKESFRTQIFNVNKSHVSYSAPFSSVDCRGNWREVIECPRIITLRVFSEILHYALAMCTYKGITEIHRF